MFLFDAWYVAAMERDLADVPLPIKVLNERIVLYRQSNGSAVALEDACVHRKLPLSMGRIRGDDIECGYHGMVYNAAGECLRIPCQDRVPKNARVRKYPLTSRYGLLWIWMGNAERADTSTIFDVAHWGDETWGVTRGDAMTVDCNYLYMTDNLLDPSHVAWVHRSTFGNAACETAPVQVSASDKGMIASRWMQGVDVAPIYVPFTPFQGLCDRLQHYEVRYPSHALIKSVFVPAGEGGVGAEDNPRSFIMDSYNFLTPVDDGHTRYYWFQMRNVAPEDQALSALLGEGVKFAFEEDREILNAIQRNFAESRTPHIDIAIDAASLRFRRRIAQLIQNQHPNGVQATG
jgi:phenylpropionate dioxygenase-like ring-hydroxylating dioxygenase large terminal subunit